MNSEINTADSQDILLEVKGLKTHFLLSEGVLKAVDGVDFTISKGESLGLIGESGSGKSVTAMSLLSLISSPGEIVGGSINLHYDDEKIDITSLNPSGKDIRKIRGNDLAMIFQEPMTSLSPVHTIGAQLEEAIFLHRTKNKSEARVIAIDMLRCAGIANPEQRFNAYPHQLSGGMRQRAMIAIALSCQPKILIADEPTTALDVTIQAQILDLIKDLQAQFNMAVLYITHDLGVIAEVCDNVAVMYLGKIVEYGAVREIFKNPKHPYTISLLKSRPRMTKRGTERLASIEGSIPIPIDLPFQCRFADRCSEVMLGRCDIAEPEMSQAGNKPGNNHWVRCFLNEKLD
ncbi:MAG: ABC transporter ATP-binding protein [Rhizobiales bacterium]|nr:ABC transporter ATP-binding protein [Hyphomicrobiales bacterium]NRB13656.1 ABC transporter ATP-binding protein [Hyphomicrobiales bacterium]